jgi:hypothetical protein
MKTLSQSDVQKVSGGANLIDQIHQAEWKAYGKPLVNGAIVAWNLLYPTKAIPLLK